MNRGEKYSIAGGRTTRLAAPARTIETLKRMPTWRIGTKSEKRSERKPIATDAALKRIALPVVRYTARSGFGCPAVSSRR
jgi:hypothetical protein